MLYFIYTYIFILGMLFGSFASVVISRIKNNESGVFFGRSHCTNCNHRLGAFDLVPLFSYLVNRGKCRYCKQPISLLYPILELSSGVLFIASSYYLLDIYAILSGDIAAIFTAIFFFILAILSIVYVFYDILYLEIPESVLLIAIIITFIVSFFQDALVDFTPFTHLPSWEGGMGDLGIIVAFGVLFLVGMYSIFLKGWKDIYDIGIILILGMIAYIIKYILYIDLEQSSLGSGILASGAIFLFLYLQYLISKGRWIGGGDFRIALLMGLLVGIYLSFSTLVATYLIGSLIGLGVIIIQAIKNKFSKKTSPKSLGGTQIPFGPFMALGIYITLFYGNIISLIFPYL